MYFTELNWQHKPIRLQLQSRPVLQVRKQQRYNGICPTNEDLMDDLLEKAQSLAHFTWLVSDRKLFLLEISRGITTLK